MYIKNCIDCEIKYLVKNSLINGHYAVVHKSPKDKINDFLSIIDEFCDTTIKDEQNNMIVGDINIDVRKKCKNAKKFLTSITSHKLNQIVDEPARVNKRKKSSTIIDHVIVCNQQS